MRLANRMALIAGGKSGIGLATAGLFLAEGARVAIVGRNKTTLDAAAEALGGGVLAVQADVTDVEAIERAVATTAERLGKLDVVFANAGVGGASPLGQTSLATLEQIIRTNLTAAFFTVQAALPQLNDRASIILNGSVHAVLGMSWLPTPPRNPPATSWRPAFCSATRRPWSRRGRSTPPSTPLYPLQGHS